MVRDEEYHRLWRKIHLTAARVRCREDFLDFCRMMRTEIPRELKCSVCRGHYERYLIENSPERSENAFKWTWKLHDSVNRRKGKVRMSYDDAADLYRSLL